MSHHTVRELPGIGEPWITLLIGTLAVLVIIGVTALVSALKSIIRSPLDTRRKLAWIGLVMATQPLGILLWILLGRDYWYRPSSTA